ncbi:homocysteine S-methyltransferase family protein [Thalassococcus lentus]|uniref:Homocysteine S-methyltransferase family protein n=1 Tax=Thalassococcus lentus TaxID=1210524 RepID=A0ABT4XX71_9RHOB|nr:homocysteine S-methyltransferase family protein [Thalassococcus lentus]MDA7426403.1 homocysteine S-methyltransferase family protein [Thalassococcus lentus]
MTEITLLDGGMGQELIRRSGKPAAPLWSTQVMIDMPGLVAEVHGDYADAGATVATTNSYAIHRDRLRGGDSNHYASEGQQMPDREHQFEALHGAALAEAQSVKNRSRVAGSVGPLGASYRSDIHPGFNAAKPLYAEVAKILAPQVDLLLFETIASLDAARACLEAGRQTDRPVWLAFTVDDEDGSFLRSGEPVSEAAIIAADADAVLANCSAPEAMPAALDALSKTGRPIGAYGNAFTMITKNFLEGGTTAADLQAREDMTPQTYADHAMNWVEMGATIVGGCCETGPAHIAEIASRLRASGYAIV